MKKRQKTLEIEPLVVATPEPEREFLDIKAAANLVFVSPATIRRKLTQGELTRYKIFSRTLIRKSELIQKIQAVRS